MDWTTLEINSKMMTMPAVELSIVSTFNKDPGVLLAKRLRLGPRKKV